MRSDTGMFFSGQPCRLIWPKKKNHRAWHDNISRSLAYICELKITLSLRETLHNLKCLIINYMILDRRRHWIKDGQINTVNLFIAALLPWAGRWTLVESISIIEVLFLSVWQPVLSPSLYMSTTFISRLTIQVQDGCQCSLPPLYFKIKVEMTAKYN